MGYFSEMDSEMSGGRRTRRDYDRLMAIASEQRCPGSNRRVIGVKRDGTAWCPGCGQRVPATNISAAEDGELASHSRPGAGNTE